MIKRVIIVLLFIIYTINVVVYSKITDFCTKKETTIINEEEFIYYITIQTNNGYLSSSANAPFSSISKNITKEGYEYIMIKCGLTCTLIDSFLHNPSYFGCSNLWGTKLYTLKDFKAPYYYLSENLNSNNQVSISSAIPFYFKFNFYNLPCNNENNYNNQILYPTQTSNNCSSIQFGYQEVIIQSSITELYVNSKGNNIKLLRMSSTPLVDDNVFRIIPFEDSKIGFKDIHLNYWYFDSTDKSVGVSQTMLYYNKFNLEPTLVNQYYFRTDIGYITELNNTLIITQNRKYATPFLIKLVHK